MLMVTQMNACWFRSHSIRSFQPQRLSRFLLESSFYAFMLCFSSIIRYSRRLQYIQERLSSIDLPEERHWRTVLCWLQENQIPAFYCRVATPYYEPPDERLATTPQAYLCTWVPLYYILRNVHERKKRKGNMENRSKISFSSAMISYTSHRNSKSLNYASFVTSLNGRANLIFY